LLSSWQLARNFVFLWSSVAAVAVAAIFAYFFLFFFFFFCLE
jgi:hypothetical protein